MSIIEEFLEHQNLPNSDREQIEQIIQNFSKAGDDRSQLSIIANSADTLTLEKRYVPALNIARNSVLPCDVLVCPVGFRPAPLLLIALILKPKQLYLVHSSDSRRQAESVRDDPDIQLLGLNPDKDIHLRQVDLTSAPDNYDVIREVVQKHSREQIIVDISGGIKVMGVSLAAAAFWQRLPVVYLFGEEVQGIIKPFTEQLTILQNPYSHFGDTEFILLSALFNTHNYDAALKICLSLRESVGDVATLGTLDILGELIEIYRDWDSFTHSQWEDSQQRKIATRFRVLIGKFDRLDLNLIPLPLLKSNLLFLERIEQSWQANKRNIADEHRLIDILCGAERRAKQGKYDDAVARLYRCLEMSATIFLVRDWGLENPRNPNMSKLTTNMGGYDKLRQKFQQLAGYELPKTLGLNDQMMLLKIGGQHREINGTYEKMATGSPSLMEWRNRSTLAHGTVPVTQAVYQQFFHLTKDVVSRVVAKKEFKNLTNQATHPQLNFQKTGMQKEPK